MVEIVVTRWLIITWYFNTLSNKVLHNFNTKVKTELFALSSIEAYITHFDDHTKDI